SKILRDIRERRATEAALVEKEKFAAAGRLAATLAHEVNNPLESITNLAYLLTRSGSLDDEARRYAEMLLHEVQRAGDITRKTLGYYRQSGSLSEVDMAELVSHVLHAKRKKVESKNLRVRVAIPTFSSIKAPAGEVRQVFDNLVENAIDAVPLDGNIEVTAQTEDRDGRAYLVVSVCDDGPGIPAEVLPRIFEPFFTTKAGKGSGLGLWVSRAIVEKIGGKIEVESRRGQSQGTRFTIVLPLAAHESPAIVTPIARAFDKVS
ncbi:MAG TPA: HAMP domain-containing sensor histidine kinase, partial [Candidatus Koribacter sp.]